MLLNLFYFKSWIKYKCIAQTDVQCLHSCYIESITNVAINMTAIMIYLFREK